MSYLVRLTLPDEPGALGEVAQALGLVGANIASLDVVEQHSDGVVDDLVVELPEGALPDVVLTAVHAVDGAHIDSLRPFYGTIDHRDQVEMLAALAAQADSTPRTLERLLDVVPGILTATWGIVLDVGDDARRVAASESAPQDNGERPADVGLRRARVIDPEEDWVPESWALLETELAGAPLPGTGLVVVLGRTGGPGFLPREVSHLGNVATVVGGLLRRCS